MKKKILFLLIFVLFISGCGENYETEINNARSCIDEVSGNRSSHYTCKYNKSNASEYKGFVTCIVNESKKEANYTYLTNKYAVFIDNNDNYILTSVYKLNGEEKVMILNKSCLK